MQIHTLKTVNAITFCIVHNISEIKPLVGGDESIIFLHI